MRASYLLRGVCFTVFVITCSMEIDLIDLERHKNESFLVSSTFLVKSPNNALTYTRDRSMNCNND